MTCLPKISIITPSYNQGMFIEQTIQSVIDQAYPNYELIIIDGGSTDETIDIIQKYAPYITYWVSEKDNGQADAINKGLQVATGDIFNWINSDDFLEPGALHAVGNFFHANPHTHVLCGYTRCFWDEDNITSHEYRMGVRNTIADTITSIEMNQPGTFYKTSIIRELGGINASLRYVFDDELWFRFLCEYGLGKVGFIEDRLAQFRLHGHSKSVGEGYELFHKELNTIYASMLNQMNAPLWLRAIIEEEFQNVKYQPVKEWKFQYLELSRFVAHFAHRYINTLYIKGHIKEAKEAMRLIIDNGYFRNNRILLSLRLKLLFK